MRLMRWLCAGRTAVLAIGMLISGCAGGSGNSAAPSEESAAQVLAHRQPPLQATGGYQLAALRPGLSARCL